MATTVAMFDSMKLALLNSTEHLSETFRVALGSAGWTPDMNTSTVASLTSKFVALAGGNTKQCPGPGQAAALITLSAAGRVKFDLSDIALTASTGNVSARYGFVFKSATEGSYNTITPAFYWEVSSTEVVANIINVTWPSGGLMKTDDNV